MPSNAREVGQRLNQNMQGAGQSVRDATVNAGYEAAEEIERRGRADIAAGGHFGGAWTSAFNARVSDEGSRVNIDVTMGDGPPVSYWKIFEYGATINAKNPSGLMWIPFDRENKQWPRDYGNDKLFRIKNALFDKATREPMYLGTPSVTIPQKFHLHDIIKEVAADLRKHFKVSMR